MFSLDAIISSLKQKYKIEVIAGYGGLFHSVSGFSYAEDLGSVKAFPPTSFIKEIVLTTGISVSSGSAEEYLESLINLLHSKKASALIVCLGAYIKEIPRETVSLCNKIDFPLLAVPPSISLASFSQEVEQNILKEKLGYLKVKELCRAYSLKKLSAAHFLSPIDAAEGYLNDYKAFLSSSSLGIVLLSLPKEQEGVDMERYLDYFFNAECRLPPLDFCCFVEARFAVYVFSKPALDYAHIIEEFSKKTSFFKQSVISYSPNTSSLSTLHLAYSRALLAKCFAPKNKTLCAYDALGAQKILAEIGDKSVLLDLYKSIFDKLKVLSQEKASEYLNTLVLYLEMSGGVQKTATEKSMHRNTINYRINKLEDILGLDLHDWNGRYHVQTAIYVKQIMEETPEFFE